MRILPRLAFCLVPIVACSLTGQGRSASGGPLHPKQACFDVQHYDMRLRIDPEARTIEGSVGMTAVATADTDAIFLDLDGRLTVRKVLSGGLEIKFRHEDGKVHIELPAKVRKGETFQVVVHYGGEPRVAPRAPWDGGFTWSKTKSGAHWIATTCQGEGADLWWPCKDHPSDKPETMDLQISVPRDLYCAANGKLVGQTASSDPLFEKKAYHTFIWRIRVPISNYCVALNIAPYEVLHKKYTSVTGEKFDTFFYVLPESVSKAKKAFPHFLDHLRHMEEVCGPYPFRGEKYAIVETPHLGMEHQTIIAYGNHYKVDKDGYDWLHHHEMSHEWWGNLVTCRDWKDMWIHEGIGTYMQALYMEKLHGRQGYLRAMRGKRLGIGNRKALAPREVQDSLQIYSGHDIYNKGSWIMHSLRWLMGDEKFFVALRRMAYPDPEMEKVTDGSCVRLTDTEEIRAIAEKYHGADLSWFFEVYLRQPKLPAIESKREAGKLVLAWRVPVEVDFEMPIPVQVGKKTIRVAMPKGKGELQVKDGVEVRIDPEGWILRETRRRRRRR